MDIEKLLGELTIEEKAALLSGTQSMRTNGVPRLGIDAMEFSDGPHGLRKLTGEGVDGLSTSEKSTCFPTAATMACGWNDDNTRRAGEAIGEEARHYGVSVLLGPGVNIKRDPRCGRNFEYYSEDPLVAGKLGGSFVGGVQSTGVGVSVKHFACNSNEDYRFMGDSVVDERAMREIYLRAFEDIVRQEKPYTLMCAYNKLNGVFCASNKWLLNDVLRGEWGFDGLVMSDWGAMVDRIEGVKAGLDLEMPGDIKYFRKQIIDGARDGRLSMDDIDAAVRNMLTLIDRSSRIAMGENVDFKAHHALAGDIAADCAVLLKNDGILPLDGGRKYLAAGKMFEKMRYQGAGSSMVNSTEITSAADAFRAAGVNFTKNAEEAADCDAILFFCGLTDDEESEGGDRANIDFPKDQLDELNALIKTGKKVVAVLFGGAVMELPFESDASAILYMALPGQNGGSAVEKLLFGKCNPCGKLAETWPLRLADVPFCDKYVSGEIELYRESVFVGYRYYDTAKKAVRYPFGYGLSYTQFAYSDMSVKRDDGGITVSFDVENTGSRGGAEVSELYAKLEKSRVFRPEKELIGFTKTYLEAGEKKRVTIRVDMARLAYYDVNANAWLVENGEYEIFAAASVNDVRLSAKIAVTGEPDAESPYSQEVMAAYSLKDGFAVSDAVFEKLICRALPKAPPTLPITMESRFTDMNETRMGRLIYKLVMSVANAQIKKAMRLPEGAARDNMLKSGQFMKRIFDSNSPRSLCASSNGIVGYNVAEGFVELANGHFFRGIGRLCSPYRAPKLPRKKKRG